MVKFHSKLHWQLLIYASITVLCLSGFMLGKGVYIQAKGWVAQWLIADAWNEQRHSGGMKRPWSWADTYPIAELEFDEKSVIVLAGTSGRNLAFGPTLQLSTAHPESPGNIVIYGHNDTHFRRLNQLAIGDMVAMTGASGYRVQYRVSRTLIAHETEMELVSQTATDQLTLVTCYPFSGLSLRGSALNYPAVSHELLSNGELRFVVIAEPFFTAEVTARKSHATMTTTTLLGKSG